MKRREYNTVRRETLAPGKFGKFGEWLWICQITIRQIFPLFKVPRANLMRFY